MKRSARVHELLGSLPSGARPLEGKSVYMHAVKKRHSAVLTDVIKQLGGSVEAFLNRDVSCLVTGRREGQKDPPPVSSMGGAKPMTKDDRSLTPTQRGHSASPNPVAPLCGSRGRALLEKAMHNSDRCHSNDVLSSARSWGVRILLVDEFMWCLDLLTERSKQTRPQAKASEAPAKRVVKAGALKTPFIKVEDSSRRFRPLYSHSMSIPELNYRARFSPFEPPASHAPKAKHTPQEPPVPQAQNRDVGPCGSADLAPPPSSLKPPRKKSPGYCECCQLAFTDQEQHVKCEQHLRFAQHSDNYAVLDQLMESIECLFLFNPAHSQDFQLSSSSSPQCILVTSDLELKMSSHINQEALTHSHTQTHTHSPEKPAVTHTLSHAHNSHTLTHTHIPENSTQQIIPYPDPPNPTPIDTPNPPTQCPTLSDRPNPPNLILSDRPNPPTLSDRPNPPTLSDRSNPPTLILSDRPNPPTLILSDRPNHPTPTLTPTPTLSHTPDPPTLTLSHTPDPPTLSDTPDPLTLSDTPDPLTLSDTPDPPTPTLSDRPNLLTLSHTPDPPTPTLSDTPDPLTPTLSDTPDPLTLSDTPDPPTPTLSHTPNPPTPTLSDRPNPPTLSPQQRIEEEGQGEERKIEPLPSQSHTPVVPHTNQADPSHLCMPLPSATFCSASSSAAVLLLVEHKIGAEQRENQANRLEVGMSVERLKCDWALESADPSPPVLLPYQPECDISLRKRSQLECANPAPKRRRTSFDRQRSESLRTPPPSLSPPPHLITSCPSDLEPPLLHPYFHYDTPTEAHHHRPSSPPTLSPCPSPTPSYPFGRDAVLPLVGWRSGSSEPDWDSGLLLRLTPAVPPAVSGGRQRAELELLLQSCTGLKDSSYHRRLCSALHPLTTPS